MNTTKLMRVWRQKMNERTPYLQELIRFSSEATLIIGGELLDENKDGSNKFEKLRKALDFIKHDKKLIVHDVELGDGNRLINIKIRDDKKCQKS